MLQLPSPFPERRPWEWHYSWSGGAVGFLLMMLTMVVVFGVIVGGIVLIARWIISLGRDKPDALEILKQRYARGEIDRDEFEQRKKDILS